MIAYLDGRLVKALPTQVVMEVGGVGYEVFIPMSTFDQLPAAPAAVKLLTHLVVREDAHVLYGFSTEDERALFRLLINSVSGVGPRLALAVLSGMSVRGFRAAVVGNDVASIARVKGLGKKTAEKIVVELRDKVGVSAAWEVASAEHAPSPEAQAVNDAVLALIALGYKQAEAHKAAKAALDAEPSASVETLVREALKRL
ncbi:MAG TPA: Holliday junction branch migration protein RuvA [Verrucomicrobiae bacterium]|nr:Holliday junction branch migration protein RuvA [Verrucomicrobiae bacterium]